MLFYLDSDYYLLGISVISAAPFSPPVAFRVKVRPHVAKHERDHITEGRCHKCNKWIALETVKDTEVKVRCVEFPNEVLANCSNSCQVKEIFWYVVAPKITMALLINLPS